MPWQFGINNNARVFGASVYIHRLGIFILRLFWLYLAIFANLNDIPLFLTKSNSYEVEDWVYNVSSVWYSSIYSKFLYPLWMKNCCAQLFACWTTWLQV